MDSTNIVDLLNSKSWSEVLRGVEGFRKIENPMRTLVMEEVLPGLGHVPLEASALEIRIQAWEDCIEGVEFSSDDGVWSGGIRTGGKTQVEVSLGTNEKDEIEMVLSCIKSRYWDSTLGLYFEYPDSVEIKDSESFYRDGKSNVNINGEPEGAVREYLDSIGTIYRTTWEFSPSYYWLSVDGVEVNEHMSGAYLVILGIVNDINFDKITDINENDYNIELSELKDLCYC
jgi:hypothetical protein